MTRYLLRRLVGMVVVMFLALSVTFDETLTSHPRLGVACNLAGLLFAVLVSEGVLRVIRLDLPARFRVPYYLILFLFFLYPATLVPLLGDPSSKSTGLLASQRGERPMRPGIS